MWKFKEFIDEIEKIDGLMLKKKITHQEHQNLIEKKLENRILHPCGFEEINIEDCTYSIIKSATGKSIYQLKIFRDSCLIKFRRCEYIDLSELDFAFIVYFGLNNYLKKIELEDSFNIIYKPSVNPYCWYLEPEQYIEICGIKLPLWGRRGLISITYNHIYEGLKKMLYDCKMNTYSEIEKEIYFHYGGEKALKEYWSFLLENEKSDFKKIEKYYAKYRILYHNHYDDLKFYALMYRNVRLSSYYYDAISVIYFAERYNEIVGFKTRLEQADSLKAQIAFLYYENEALFPIICKKLVGVEFNRNFESVLLTQALQEFSLNHIPHVFSINDMTDSQCSLILNRKKYLDKEYLSMFDKHSIREVKVYNDEIEYTYDYFMPYILGKKISCSDFSDLDYYHSLDNVNENYFLSIVDIKSFERKRISRYLSMKYKEMNLINELKSEMYNIIKQLTTYKCKVADSLKKYKNNEMHYTFDKSSFNYNLWSYEEQQEHRKQHENKQKEIKQKLNKKKIKRDIINILKEYSVWHYVYNHQKEINNYVEQCNIRVYNICWIRHPQAMRDLERMLTCKEPIDSSFNKYFEIYKGKGSLSTGFSHLLEFWNGSIKEERKLQILKQEEEERRKEEAKKWKYSFNIRNKHRYDNNIIFYSEEHKYEVNGIALDSVTTFVDNAFPKFNSLHHARRKAKQLGITSKEVLEMWEKKGKESRDLGTTMHSKIENYYLGYDSEETDAYKLFKMFAEKCELKPYRTEWTIYDWEHKIAGTIDFVDYQNGEYIIYDWKRSDKIIENGIPVKINRYGEKGNYPLEHLDNTPYYHYALQLSLYKYILEKNYGMKISDLRLGIFHPTYNKPYVLRMPYLEKEINNIFNLRSEILF